MRIHLKERRQETSEVISFVFDLGGQPLDYSAGQFAFFELDELAFPDERGKRRHFTISSAPTETKTQGIIMITTRLRGSGFKETLRHSPLGYELTVEPPKGRFTLPAGEIRPHLFIAGGIGITPYRSILRNAADLKATVNATLLHLNRTSADIVFRDELENLARQMPTLKLVHILEQPEAGWQGATGQLTQALLDERAPNYRDSLIWLSGPPGFVHDYRERLSQLGVNEENLRADSFTGYN